MFSNKIRERWKQGVFRLGQGGNCKTGEKSFEGIFFFTLPLLKINRIVAWRFDFLKLKMSIRLFFCLAKRIYFLFSHKQIF